MTVDNQQPQPGAKQHVMLRLGLPPIEIERDGWIPLPAREAVNFTDAEPFLLTPDVTVFRVYGDPARVAGGYWSPSPPAPDSTEADWRSETAVELSWNSAASVASFTPASPVQAWRGGVRAQPAQNMAGEIMPGDQDWWLMGEGTQVRINSYPTWTYDPPTVLGPVPWPIRLVPPPKPVEAAPLPASVDPADPLVAHAQTVVDLARSLRTIVPTGMDATDEDAGSIVERLTTMANILINGANEIVVNVTSEDPVASAKVARAVRSQVGLSRHVELDAHWHGADEAMRRLDEVILRAAALSGVGE